MLQFSFLTCTINQLSSCWFRSFLPDFAWQLFYSYHLPGYAALTVTFMCHKFHTTLSYSLGILDREYTAEGIVKAGCRGWGDQLKKYVHHDEWLSPRGLARHTYRHSKQSLPQAHLASAWETAPAPFLRREELCYNATVEERISGDPHFNKIKIKRWDPVQMRTVRIPVNIGKRSCRIEDFILGGGGINIIFGPKKTLDWIISWKLGLFGQQRGVSWPRSFRRVWRKKC